MKRFDPEMYEAERAKALKKLKDRDAKKPYDVRDAYRRMKKAYKYYEDAELQALFDEMKLELPKTVSRMESLDRKLKETGSLTHNETLLKSVLKDDLLVFNRAMKEMGTAMEDDANMKRFSPAEYAARRAKDLEKLKATLAKKKA
jgi:hypothetical protein